MNSSAQFRGMVTPAWTILAVVALSACLTGRAQTLVYQNFISTTGLSVNGDAATTTTSDGKVIRLVAAPNTSDAGSFFTNNPVNISTFSTVFQFRLSSPGGTSTDGQENGADGFTFTLQTAAKTAVGGYGEGLGYQNIGTSVAVEFDLWRNSYDPILSNGGSNHVGIDTGGSVTSLTTAQVATKLDNGGLWTAWIDYNGSTLELRLSDTSVRPSSALLSHSISITGQLESTTAFVGFTAGTGSNYANHDILNWAYSPSYVVGGLSAVPEPGTYALLGLGGLVLLGARRFRRTR